MTSPPTAAHPATRLSDAGSPRGNLRETPNEGRMLDERRWRVMLEDGESLRKGDIIAAKLRYALEAPNGRRIPIPNDELHDWLNDFYAPAENRRHQRVALVRDAGMHGMWAGSSVGTINIQCGDWRILQSDEAVLKLSQMHTVPLSKLDFGISKSGHLVARYLKDRTPTAISLQTSATGVHHTEKPNR